jgi:hypothetical protein
MKNMQNNDPPNYYEDPANMSTKIHCNTYFYYLMYFLELETKLKLLIKKFFFFLFWFFTNKIAFY